MMSVALRPASARRTHAAFLSPWGNRPSGNPASFAMSRNQLVKPASVNGAPYAVMREGQVIAPGGCQNVGKAANDRDRHLGAGFLLVMVRKLPRTCCHPMRMTSERRCAV